ncbi:MAG: hypothetical protein N2116_05115 [Armatimonadetes bacterium]|nr:hypothetical protein [Armatimonadota bacterium]
MGVQVRSDRKIVYPESDRKPWSNKTSFDNRALFRKTPNAFVAALLLWCPVESEPRICTAA